MEFQISRLFKKVHFRFADGEEEENDEDEGDFTDHDLNDQNEISSPNHDQNSGQNDKTTRRYLMRNLKQLNQYRQNIYDSYLVDIRILRRGEV